VSVHLVLAVLAVIALRVGFLYLAPFGPCPNAKGREHPARPPPPGVPRCKGKRCIQRTGSRTIHRLAFKIRHGQQTAARYRQQEDSHENP
jgi:hypothetical protein